MHRDCRDMTRKKKLIQFEVCGVRCDSNLITFTVPCGHRHRHRQCVETHRDTFADSVEEKDIVRENPLCIHPKQDCSF